jgi:hypothetical protein
LGRGKQPNACIKLKIGTMISSLWVNDKKKSTSKMENEITASALTLSPEISSLLSQIQVHA